MIFSYLEKLRRKPVEVRKTYAIVITVMITGVVVLIWFVFSLINNFGIQPAEKNNTQSKSQSVTDLFEQSNDFLEEVNQNVYTEDENNWTQELRQFDDDSLLFEKTTPEEDVFMENAQTASST